LGVPNQNQTGMMVHEDFSLVDRDRCENMKTGNAQQCTWPSALRQKPFEARALGSAESIRASDLGRVGIRCC
jgi:hypothetical protein